jgi:hypothetical protein
MAVFRLLFSFIIGTSFLSLSGQHSWSVKGQVGFLLPHHEDMQAMMAHVTGYELAREWKLDSAGFLAHRHKEPRVAMGVNYLDLGNKINGKAYTVFGYYELGLISYKKFSIRGRFGGGLGYLTKQFNAFTNPMNRAIGSHVNAFMNASGYLQWRVTPRIALQLGMGMSHHSNGNFSQPNLGVNEPAVIFGLQFRDAKLGYIKEKPSTWFPRPQLQFGIRAGRRQISIDEAKNFNNVVGEIMLLYPHNPIRMWHIGMNVYYDRTYQYEKFQPMPKPRIDKATELAIVLGHEYRIGRIGFITDFGFYLYRPDDTKRMYYEAVGVKYYINDRWTVTNRLKAHLTSADFFEFGCAYAIQSKRAVLPGIKGMFRTISNPKSCSGLNL